MEVHCECCSKYTFPPSAEYRTTDFRRFKVYCSESAILVAKKNIVVLLPLICCVSILTLFELMKLAFGFAFILIAPTCC